MIYGEFEKTIYEKQLLEERVLQITFRKPEEIQKLVEEGTKLAREKDVLI